MTDRMSNDIVIRSTATGPLPTLDGYARAIVAVDGQATTVQCEVCYRTATGKSATVIRLGGWHFAGDTREERALPYRRCPDCRAAHAHPEAST